MSIALEQVSKDFRGAAAVSDVPVGERAVRFLDAGGTLVHPDWSRLSRIAEEVTGRVFSIEEMGRAFAEAWNFSPPVEEARSVSWLVERLRSSWPGELSADGRG